MENLELPANFRSTMVDFTNDLTTTFPEFSYMWSKWGDSETSDDEMRSLFRHCLKIYPQRFFDILYENDTIFGIDDETEVYFLPNMSFRLLYNCEGITETTKKSIWKYLQLVLFTIVGSVKDKTTFGDSINMFDSIDENDLQSKLADTMKSMSEFFNNMEDKFKTNGDGDGDEVPNLVNPEMHQAFENMFKEMGSESSETDANDSNESPFSKMGKNSLPNIKNIQEHLKSLFDGKIGKLAKEMAEELADELKNDFVNEASNINSTQDALKHLMQNPNKIKDLMKKVGTKLDSKMQSGEISREELMKEAQGLLGKMKDMGGGQDMNKLFKEMAQKMGMGKDVRINKNALEKFTKMGETREKMKARAVLRKQKEAEEMEKKKADIRKRVEEQQKLRAAYSLDAKNETNELVFRLAGEEKQEKSFIHPDLLKEMEADDKKKQQNSGDDANGKKKKKKNK
jgi:hypothetical protein